MPIISRLNAVAFILTLALGVLVPAQGAMAKKPQVPFRTAVEFNGQITAVGGPTDAPTSLILQDRAGKSVTFKVRMNTNLKPLSAEAEVEGLVTGDYADLFAIRVNRTWVATLVQFDVEPVVLTRQVTVTGTVTRVRADGGRLWMKLDSGEVRAVAIPAKTVWLFDGFPAGGPLVLARGDVVQVKMKRTAGSNGWFALSINLKSSAG